MPFFITFIKKLSLKQFYVIFLLFIALSETLAQERMVVDSLYREDQFYVSLTYNLLQNKPSGFSQHSLSSGISVGFLRDMPINKKRTWAIAAGLGYNYNNLKTNIKIESLANSYAFSIDNSFEKNKLVLHELELPLEIRWRNSTFESHKFWRIYTGFKASYLFADKSEFESETEIIKLKNNSELNKVKLGTYLAVGNNTGNIYVYYGLTPLFKNANIGTEKLEMNAFNIGFVFYIL